jgi:hypothetical protein
MRERAQAAGGRLAVRAGAGLELELRVPAAAKCAATSAATSAFTPGVTP